VLKMDLKKKWLDALVGIALRDYRSIAIRAVVEDADGNRFEARSNNSIFRRSWI
jgi:hypothetical protein